MGLQTPFDKPIYPNTSDLGGDVATTRGTDPNAAGGQDHGGGILNFWEDSQQAMAEGAEGSSGPSQAESPNSVSGLPSLPNRFAPSDTPPEMPTMKDRIPGTIDK